MGWVQRLRNRFTGAPKVPFPFFVPVVKRQLTDGEYRAVTYLLIEQPDSIKNQVDDLEVVGRCGCRIDCPTIFFQAHDPGENEQELSSLQGRDQANGLVGAILFHKQGRLSQLDIFSIDGHEPWSVPAVETFEPLR